MSEILSIENVHFAYQGRGLPQPILRGVSLSVIAGEFVAIQGRSGSGKSTLFYLLGALLSPDSGKIYFEGRDLGESTHNELAAIRNRRIGFVFQQFHLLPRATVLDNILLPSLYDPMDRHPSGLRDKAIELAQSLEIGDRLSHLPNQLSGGEQQRVAIARAMLGDPSIILADEPTGNLDSHNAGLLMELFERLNGLGHTIVMITHDPEIAKRCSRICYLTDGRFVGEERREKRSAPIPSVAVKSDEPSRKHRVAVEGVSFALALQNLRRNKLRAFLTMVGVTIGIAAVFAMVTFGQFAKEQILKGFEELGVNTVMLRGYPNENRSAKDDISVLFRSFDWDKDLLPLKSIFPEVRLLSPMMASWGNTAGYGGLSIENEVMAWGVNAEYHGMVTRHVTLGRPIVPYDVENRNPVCLIGSEISDRLFKHAPPTGQILFLSNKDGLAFPCRIVGVLSPENSMKDWRKPNLEVLLPFTYLRRVTNQWASEIHAFVTQVHSGADVERTGVGVKKFFEQKYGKSGEFYVDSNSLLLAQVKKFLGLFTLLLASIALITLGVGGMGINNMMLVSVSERLKEIGLRKAVGATRSSIRHQFLFESTTLSVLAGIAGVGLGFSTYELIIYLASRFVSRIQFAWVVDPTALALSVISMVAVGIVSGIVPAFKAERLSVIEALRSE